MTRLNDLTSLRTRVAGLTGPDREVDAAICARLPDDQFPDDATSIRPALDGSILFSRRSEPGVFAVPGGAVPHFTSSLDAITALIERVVPGRSMTMGIGQKTAHGAIAPSFLGQAKTMPLALCLALLDALIEKERAGAGQ